MFYKISKFISKRCINRKCETKNGDNEYAIEKNVLSLFSKIHKHFVQYNFANENYKYIY